jgi:PBP1b-binding outer membrane lipoprotein LpoB
MKHDELPPVSSSCPEKQLGTGHWALGTRKEREPVKKTVIITAIGALLLVGCSQKKQENAATENAPQPAKSAAIAPATTPALPPGHPPIDTTTLAATASAAPAPVVAARQIHGKLLESLNAAGYTYLRIKTDAGEQWAAVRETKVKKGDLVAVNVQMVMDSFESKTLKRKFDKIVFGVIAGSNDAAPPSMASSAAQPAVSPMGTAAQHMNAGTANVGDVSVPKAAGGKTVAEAWAGRDQLKDKPVVIRGKVVKFLSGIMGKNWLHLRDGSGSADKGDNDITVTTNEVAAVGDVVTVTGTLRIDKDFGAGYRYPVILEEAKLAK